MKRSFFLLLVCTLLSGLMYSQSVKKSTKDTSKYRANDRLRPAGPKNGWGEQKTLDLNSKKNKKDTVAIKPKVDSIKKRN